MMEEAYGVIVQAYEILDQSHENYVNLVEEAIIEAEYEYLEEYFKLYSMAHVTCSQVFDKRERAKLQGGFKVARNKGIVGMQAFKSSCEVLTKLSLEKSICFADMRAV